MQILYLITTAFLLGTAGAGQPLGLVSKLKRLLSRRKCPYKNTFEIIDEDGESVRVRVQKIRTHKGVDSYQSLDGEYLFKTPNPDSRDWPDVTRRFMHEKHIMELLGPIYWVPQRFRMPEWTTGLTRYTCGETTLVTSFVGPHSLGSGNPQHQESHRTGFIGSRFVDPYESTRPGSRTWRHPLGAFRVQGPQRGGGSTNCPR